MIYAPRALLALAFVSITAARAIASDDVIFDPARPVIGHEHTDAGRAAGILPPQFVAGPDKPDSRAMAIISAANITIAEVVRKFMSGMIPDENGNDTVVPDENPIDQFVKRIGDSKFQWLIQGVGNLKVLNGPYFYNEIQGGLGVEYDLVGRSENVFEDQTDTVVALRFSPLYGEIAYLRMATGALDPAGGLPSRALLGASFGFEAMRRLGPFEPGVRAYVRPLIETSGANDFGASIEASVYCRIKLADLHGLDPLRKTDLYLTPYISYYDRSSAIADLDDTEEPGLFRGTGAIRHNWIGGFNLEIRR